MVCVREGKRRLEPSMRGLMGNAGRQAEQYLGGDGPATGLVVSESNWRAIMAKKGNKFQPQTLVTAGAFEQTDRTEMIATAAYYRAERRDFAPGQDMDDWLDAEREIEERLAWQEKAG